MVAAPGNTAAVLSEHRYRHQGCQHLSATATTTSRFPKTLLCNVSEFVKEVVHSSLSLSFLCEVSWAATSNFLKEGVVLAKPSGCRLRTARRVAGTNPWRVDG